MRRYLSNAQLRNLSFSFKFLKSRNSYPLQIFINTFLPNHPLMLSQIVHYYWLTWRLPSKKSIINIDKIKTPSFLMVITATGNLAHKRADGVLIVPIGTLGK